MNRRWKVAQGGGGGGGAGRRGERTLSPARWRLLWADGGGRAAFMPLNSRENRQDGRLHVMGIAPHFSKRRRNGLRPNALAAHCECPGASPSLPKWGLRCPPHRPVKVRFVHIKPLRIVPGTRDVNNKRWPSSSSHTRERRVFHDPEAERLRGWAAPPGRAAGS